MTSDEKFDLIFVCGNSICSAYTGFSKFEIAYCQNKNNWLVMRQFLMSDSPYEALINLDLSPLKNNIIDYLGLIICSMFHFPDEAENVRLKNLLTIIDDFDYLDIAVKNTKIIKALLALNRRYSQKCPYSFYSLFLNCKKVLAHIFKKYPDFLKSNILRSTGKNRMFRFTEKDIETYF